MAIALAASLSACAAGRNDPSCDPRQATSSGAEVADWIMFPLVAPVCVIQAGETQPGGSVAPVGVSSGGAAGGYIPSNNSSGQEMDLKQGLGWTQIVPEGGNDYWVHQTVPDGN